MKRAEPVWAEVVDPQDFSAGRSYLELLYPPREARALVNGLRRARIQLFQAKDILRASDLGLVGASNPNVQKQFRKMRRGEPLSPLLLVREPGGRARLLVADGFHRLCATVHIDETLQVPCKIV